MGVIVANWLIGKVAEVERFNDSVMEVIIVIGNIVWEVVSYYRLQVDRSVNEKEEFYELIANIVTIEKVLVGGDFNGPVGRDMGDMGGFGEAHVGLGLGK